MGNRALIQPKGKNVCVYLHWNGGADSVVPFLKYCELRGFRPFEDSYGLARFVQIVSNFFGGSLSIGVEDHAPTEEDIDWMDNGLYIVKGWKIVGRKVYEGYEDEKVSDLKDFLKEIDKCQPENDRLGDLYFNSKPVKVKDMIANKMYLIRKMEGQPFEKVICVKQNEEKGYISQFNSFVPFGKNDEIREIISYITI